MKTRFSTKIKMAAAACCTSVALIGACPMTTLAYSGHDFDRIGKLSGYSKQGYRYKVGDCNGDGRINLADYITLTLYCNRLEGGFWSWAGAVAEFALVWCDHYDINGDGNVNRTDANILYSYVLSR